VLTDAQRHELATTGVTYMRGVLARADADAIADQIWAAYADKGVLRDDRSTWPVAGLEVKLQKLRKSGMFRPFDNATTRGALDELLGHWSEPDAWGAPLISFPGDGPWRMPTKIWHFDHRAEGDPEKPFLMRMFGFVNDVGPEGGGTLIIEGTHELVRRMVAAAPDHKVGSSADVKKLLAKRYDFFQAPSFDPVEIDGVRVCVRELTGEAGDVALMLPWTMHNINMNCGDQPRFMVTHTVFRG